MVVGWWMALIKETPSQPVANFACTVSAAIVDENDFNRKLACGFARIDHGLNRGFQLRLFIRAGMTIDTKTHLRNQDQLMGLSKRTNDVSFKMIIL